MEERMKRIKRISVLSMIISLVITIVGSVSLTAGEDAVPGKFAEEFLQTWKNARAYSLEMAKIMPEKHYTFKPTPEIMSFAEQNAHTAGSMYWFASKVLGEPSPAQGYKAEGKTKAEIIKFLSDAFDYGEKALMQLTDKAAQEKVKVFGDLILTKAQLFLAMRDHITHHRGAMVIYLRLKGFKPATYRGW
jgi:uncharacterized damage-inducible protein DinB